ncbi:hypothetical protein CHS0354_033067 [Potamilus streckersoni]|uniref:Uncharacterized protein n=1 Tax=Potamilus streckersoni TaxID=2493646 RepID=A0AAE0W6D6_9BIVA|nr:hypothetical protein CHS0354_033067 [Potamilus streckersoni]
MALNPTTSSRRRALEVPQCRKTNGKPDFDSTLESSNGNKTIKETLSPESPTQNQEEKTNLSTSTLILP